MPWELESDRPIYAQLVERLELAVLSGRFPPGGRLPSVRELAAEAGVNPNTMQRALTHLEQAGLIATQRTAGRTVTEDPARIERVRHALARERTARWKREMAELGYGAEALEALLLEAGEEGRSLNGDSDM